MGGRGASSSADTSYWLSHRPGNPLEYPDEVATIDKITTSELFPADILSRPEMYLPVNREGTKETISILKRVQGDPDATVTVYRGAPSNNLNTGDWVTLNRSYAELYAGSSAYSDNPNSKVYSFTAKASELSFDGDDFNEFGYWGKRQVAR